MDFKTRREYYNRCDPNEPLAPDNPFNVDIDRLSHGQARGVLWEEKLAGRIELSREPVFLLFTGLPGAGKSTELKRLEARLRRQDGARLLPVRIDAEDLIDLANPIDIPDLLAAILFGTEACVLQAEGKDPERAMEEGYLARMWAWLTKTDLELGKAEFSIPSGPKLVAEMRTRPTLRKRVRAVVGAHLSQFLREVQDELVLLEERARRLGYRGLIVIFDSLEKLRGISSNWEDVLASAERVFAAGAPYLRLPVHVLYTIPAALIGRRIAQVEFMPMVKLHTAEGEPFEPGLAAAREIIRRRVPDDVLGELLGPAAEERIRELIRWSGGYPREMIRLLQNAFTASKIPLLEADFRRLWNELRDAYRRTVPADAFDWLARVAVEHYLTFQNDGHRKAADLMLSNSAVLCYTNEREWYDLHPAVREIPGVVQAIEAARDELKDAGSPT